MQLGVNFSIDMAAEFRIILEQVKVQVWLACAVCANLCCLQCDHLSCDKLVLLGSGDDFLHMGPTLSSCYSCRVPWHLPLHSLPFPPLLSSPLLPSTSCNHSKALCICHIYKFYRFNLRLCFKFHSAVP